jgi:hypothetical protein
LYRLSHFNFDDSFNKELNDVNERHKDKLSVSKFSNESIIKSRQSFFISVLLIFNDVKFVNLSMRQRFGGIEFADDVEGFVELQIEKKSSLVF